MMMKITLCCAAGSIWFEIWGVVNLRVNNFDAGRLGADTVNTGIYIAQFEKGYRCCRCVLCDPPHTKIQGNATPNPQDWCLSQNCDLPPNIDDKSTPTHVDIDKYIDVNKTLTQKIKTVKNAFLLKNKKN